MALSIQDSRILLKRSTNTSEVPTAAPSSDFTDGTWTSLDVYVGEAFANVADEKLWLRFTNNIRQIAVADSPTVNRLTYWNASGHLGNVSAPTDGYYLKYTNASGYIWATAGGGNETLAQTLALGNTSGAYDILMNTTQRIGFKDGDNTNTSYISNNQTTGGSRTAYLPLFDGQLAYHAAGVPLSDNYILRGTTNGAITSSSILRDNGSTLAVNSTTHVSTAALKVKGRLIVSTQEVTSNDNYIAMLEVGVGNGVLFSNGTSGATAANQLGYIFGDGGLQIYGRDNAAATKFFFSGKATANRFEFYSDDANTHFKMTSTGVLNYTQAVNNDGFNVIRSNAATTTPAAYSAISVINADATANRVSVIGFTYQANVARNAFIGARFIDNDNGDLFLGAKASGVEFTGATLYSNGNFGINTSSSATARLQVKGSTSDSTAYALKVDNSASSALLYVRNDGAFWVNTNAGDGKFHFQDGDFRIYDGANKRMVLLQNGRLTYGATTINSRFHFYDPNATASEDAIMVETNYSTTSYSARYTAFKGFNSSMATNDVFRVLGGSDSQSYDLGAMFIKKTASGEGAWHITARASSVLNLGIVVYGSGAVAMPNLPTSSAGLSAGDLWNDSGTLKIA